MYTFHKVRQVSLGGSFPHHLIKYHRISTDKDAPFATTHAIQDDASGLGGRNLEFVLSIAEAIAGGGSPRGLPVIAAGTGGAHRADLPVVAAASIGTDGIDGSSGVAGAMVDSTTLARAAQAGLELPGHYLATNNSFAFFAPLGDAIRLGRTQTNVGDLQAILIHEP